MIDLQNLEKYKENNRIEAKKATGGLPNSIWETYSSFANTLGGIILLGVDETNDKSLHPVDLPDPEWLIKDFWDSINDPKKVSVNILSDKNVFIKKIDGKQIIVITVPRAQRCDKPVYIDGDPFGGTYKRNGEGDYRCSRDEVRVMQRDASARTRDTTGCVEKTTEVFDFKLDRITLLLSIKKIDDKKSSICQTNKNKIIEYLTDHISAKTSEIGNYLGLKSSRTRDYLRELINDDIIVAKGSNRNRTYFLKS